MREPTTPVLPSEYICFLCHSILNDGVYIVCQKRKINECDASEACRACVVKWNERNTQNKEMLATIKMESAAHGVMAEEDKKPTLSNLVNDKVVTDAQNGYLCPKCGSNIIKMIPDLRVNRILQSLPLSEYHIPTDDVQLYDNKTKKTIRDHMHDDSYHSDKGTEAVGDVSEGTLPPYLLVPDKMRASEYKMTSLDISTVKSMTTDGLTVMVLRDNRVMELVLRHNLVPLTAPRGISENFGAEGYRSGSLDSVRRGHQGPCSALLPSVGGRVGSVLKVITKTLQKVSVADAELTGKMSWPADGIGSRGHHVLVLFVSGNGASVSIGGIGRVRDVEVGLYVPSKDEKADVEGAPSIRGTGVPSDVVKEFFCTDSNDQPDLNKGYEHSHQTYHGSLASSLTADLLSKKKSESEVLPALACWFLSINWLLKWRQNILLPYKSQPLYGILEPLQEVLREDIFPPAAAIPADIGGSHLIPAIIAKIRASEASTAITHNVEKESATPIYALEKDMVFVKQPRWTSNEAKQTKSPLQSPSNSPKLNSVPLNLNEGLIDPGPCIQPSPSSSDCPSDGPKKVCLPKMPNPVVGDAQPYENQIHMDQVPVLTRKEFETLKQYQAELKQKFADYEMEKEYNNYNNY